MERFRFLIIIIIIIFISSALCAEEEGDKLYRLSLDEISFLAIENNFDIQLAKYDVLIAREDNPIATSIYDTLFRADAGYNKDKSKKSSIIFGSKSTSHDYNIGLSQKLPTGTDIKADLLNNRTFTDSSFTTSPLTHESQLLLSVEQDLGKNFFGIQDRGNIKISRLDADNKQYTSLDAIEFSVAQVQKAYWDLVLAREKVTIEEDMVEQARKLFQLHQDQLDDGMIEIADAIASEVNYRSRKNELALARNDAKSKLNILKLLINKTEKAVLIEPSESLNLPIISDTFKDSLKRAFDNRRDYSSAHNDIKKYKIKLSMKKNNLWPEINLSATLSRNGFGDKFEDSVQTVTRQDNPNFFAGVTVEIPLLNTLARAELSQAQLEKAKSLLSLKQVESQIAVGVLNQVRNCQIYLETAQSSHEIMELQKQKLDQELKRYLRGRSNTDTLIRIQQDYILSRFSAAWAKHRYHTAIVDLRLIEATLLKSYWDLTL